MTRKYEGMDRWRARRGVGRWWEEGSKGGCATWKREFKLPWCKAGLLISMIKWIRTSRLSMKISLWVGGGGGHLLDRLLLRLEPTLGDNELRRGGK